MIALPPDIRFALRANAIARRAADRDGTAAHGSHQSSTLMDALDPQPVAKFFNPLGAATWLVTELDADGDTLFGLADLGFGCPELGSFSLSEIAQVRLPFGLRIERDEGFAPLARLSVWAAWAHRAGSIIHAEALLRRAAASAPHTEILQLPAAPDDGGGG